MTTESEQLPPVAVAVIGTQPIATGVIARTPGNHPDLLVTVVTPLMAITIRFINQFLTTLVGLVGAGMTPAGASVLGASDFYHLVLTCAALSVAGAGFNLLKDLVTIFGKLEGRYPLLTGGV